MTDEAFRSFKTSFTPDKFLIDINTYINLHIPHLDGKFGAFWKKLVDDGQITAFTYYIMQSVDEGDALQWFKKNPEKTRVFADWLEKNLL